jgi:uncharacterized protein (TIGR03067 family)
MGRVVSLLLLALPLVAAPVPKAKPQLNGVWEMTENDLHGQRKPEDLWILWVIDGGKLNVVRDRDMLKAFQAGDKTEALDFEIRFPDPKDPSAFDLVRVVEEKGKETLPGRWDLTEGKLTLCYCLKPTDKRPAVCQREDGLSWNVFKLTDAPLPKAK